MKGPEFYNEAYKTDPQYKLKYFETEYYLLWKEVIKEILNVRDSQDIQILELGCGVGQFGQMLVDFGFTNYKGFDFSTYAIRRAEKKNLDVDLVNIENENNQFNAEVIVSCETFEHLNDMKVLDNITEGANIVLTLPDFQAPAHIRYFPTINDVISRYQDKIFIDKLYKFGKFYVVRGRKI